MPSLTEAEELFVLPYYLKMMGLNAAHSEVPIDPVLLESVATNAGLIDHDTVVRFLRGGWRPRVMGAWYAVRQDPQTIKTELLQSLESSDGSLTAPPLATAAAFSLGSDAVPSLKIYVSSDAAARDGSGDFVQLIVEHIEARPEVPGGRLNGYAARMLSIAAAVAGHGR